MTYGQALLARREPILYKQLSQAKAGEEHSIEEIYSRLLNEILSEPNMKVESIRLTAIKPRVSEAPQKQEVGTYLHALNQTMLTALLVTLLSAVTGMFAIGGLIVFLQTNASFLHPYLAIFLAFGSAALFAVAVMSIFSVKKRIESVIGRALRISYEQY